MQQKTKKIISIISVVAMLALWGLIFYYVGKPLIKFLGEPDKFRAWVDAGGVKSRLAFIGMVMLQVVVAIIPGEPFEIAAGYAFGFIEGTALCVIGIVIGSVAVFLLTKRFGIKIARLFFSYEKLMQLRFMQNENKLNSLMFIIFMIPGTPKDLLTYFAGLTPITLKTWLFISGVARLPSVVTSTIGGAALGSEEYYAAVIVFAATALLSITGLLIYNKYTSQKNRPL